MFGNNIEAMAFDKSGWSKIETKVDGTIYMGKPFREEAAEDEPAWCIKRITKETDENGNETLTTKFCHALDANNNDLGIFRCKWTMRDAGNGSVAYKYF